MVWVREDTLRHSTVVQVFIEEELIRVRGRLGRDNQKVEVVKDRFLAGAPVIVMEVVINPEEALIKQFRDERLLDSG